MSGLDWMWQEEVKDDEKVKLSEGGDFVPGQSGLWNVAAVWRVWDGSGLDIKEMGIKVDGAQSFDSGSFYYFRNENYEEATKLCNALSLKFGPKQVWRWELPVAEWINAPADALERFGEMMAREVGIGGFGGKDRNDFHLIALPSAVQSLAVAAKMIPGPIYDYNKLAVKEDQLTDDYHHLMLGGQDDWEQSELWKARVAIWEALEETNPRAYMVEQGSKKHDATSKKLMAALRILHRPQTQVYARVLSVFHPSMEAKNKEGKPLRALVVTNVWGSEEEAKAAEGTDATTTTEAAPKAEKVEVKKAAPKASSNGVVVPPRWSGSSESDWLEWLKDFLKEKGLAGKPKPVVMKALEGMAEDLDGNYLTTPAEIEPWLSKANE